MFRDVRMTLACRAASLESPVDLPTSWKHTPASSHWITLQAVGEPSRFTHKQHGVQVPVPVRDRFQATITIKKETVTCTIVAPNSASTVCYDMSVNPNGTNANAPCTLHPADTSTLQVKDAYVYLAAVLSWRGLRCSRNGCTTVKRRQSRTPRAGLQLHSASQM